MSYIQTNADKLTSILFFQNGNLADTSSSCEEDESMTETLPNDPELARINQDKALLSLGLYRYRIPADGNCLFRAVASQLKLDQERYHPVLRKAAVKWMQANAEELIVGGMLDCLGEIEDASELGTWAGQAAIVALANIFSINIAVVQGGDKGDIDIQHISPFESSVDGDEQGSVILAYMYNGHFDAVVDQEDLPNPHYEAWQYEQVHGTKLPREDIEDEASGEIPKQTAGPEVFVPSVENPERENIGLSYLEEDKDSEMTAKTEPEVMDQSDVAESDPQTVIENIDAGNKDASAASSFINNNSLTQTDGTRREIGLDGATKLTKQLSEGELNNQKEEGNVAEPPRDQSGVENIDDQDETYRWASFFRSVHQELENSESRSPPPPLNLRLEDIPEETQSQLATPLSTPSVTPLEMENPWVNFTQTIERDSSFSDHNSSDTLTDDDSSEGSNDSVVNMDLEKENETDKSESSVSENVTFIEKTTDKNPDENKEPIEQSKGELVPTGNVDSVTQISTDGFTGAVSGQSSGANEENMEIGATNMYDQNSLGSDFSLPSQTSSMSIALATDDTDSVSGDPRPTLNMQHSQDSLTGISPWSSFSQSVEKEAQQNESPAVNSASPANVAPQNVPDRNELNIITIGNNANFSTSHVPDKFVTNVAPVPQQFKTIRDLPKQWADVKKERSSMEGDGVNEEGEVGKVDEESDQNKKLVSDSDRSAEMRSGGSTGGACTEKTSDEVINNDEHSTSKAQKNTEKTFVSSTKWENNGKADNSGKQSSNQPQHIASINISDILATENCIKCEHVVKPRIRVIPVQFCGKKGATLKSVRSSNAGTGLSISTGPGEVNIPIQSNKQRIKAEIIEERGSVDINGHQTETVERQVTYTTLPDDEPSEPKIDLIEHKPPVLTPLTGSKITITDNPNVPSPAPIIKPKKKVPVRVIHENDPVARSTSFESQVGHGGFNENPKVRNIPVMIANEERRPRSRSKSQDSPVTPSSSFSAPVFSENARSSFQQARGASYESTADKRKVSSSSTSTGYQSQTSASSSFDNSPDFPEVFSRQKSTEAAKVWDETARGIEDEADRVKQRIEAARSALGGQQQAYSASMGDSTGDRASNVSHNEEANRFSRESEKGYDAYGSGRHAHRDHTAWGSQRDEASRRVYRGDSTDSSFSNRSSYSRSNPRGSYRSETSWGSQSSTEDRQRPRASRYEEEPTYYSAGDRPNIRIGAEASRFRNQEEADRRRNEQLGGSIQIEVTHEESDPFRERLRRMTADDKPASYFDLKEDPVTVRNLLRPLNLGFVNSLLNAEIDSFFGRDDFFSDF